MMVGIIQRIIPLRSPDLKESVSMMMDGHGMHVRACKVVTAWGSPTMMIMVRLIIVWHSQQFLVLCYLSDM